jgi:hypothetical protein
MLKKLVVLLMAFPGQLVYSQVLNTSSIDTAASIHYKNITIGSYLDLYYGYNMNQSPGNIVPYVVSANRHNEVNVNLAYLDFRYQSDNIRARFIPGFGTFMNTNNANEPGTLRNIVEANAGVKPFRDKNIWIDFGVISSPYTHENAISREQLMYTRSLGTEYVPYYLSGAKITLPANDKLTFYVYVINGWQQMVDVNNGKSVATQLEFRPNPKHLINWNTYFGDERSTSSSNYRMRYLADLYWIYKSGNKISITTSFTAGLQEEVDVTHHQVPFYWWQGNFIMAFHFTPSLSLAGRLEYFSDPGHVMINAYMQDGFVGGSTGLCLNYAMADHAMLRLESRHFLAENTQFLTGNNTITNYMTWLTGNITVWF